MNSLTRNKYCFGLGTVGRDMVYSLVSMYFIVFLSEYVGVTDVELMGLTAVIVGARIFDALNDPVMGVLVDNTYTRWGKFKPWIAFGAFLSGLLTIALFANFNVKGVAFVALYGVLYILWGMAFTTNDISYWSLMPALTSDQKEREQIGSVARICANVGLFVIVGGILPITDVLGGVFGGRTKGFLALAILAVLVMWIFQLFTLVGVREPRREQKGPTTTLKIMLETLVKNDQLLFTGISMALFMIGYTTTTGFGIPYFKYVYGNEDTYSVFAVVLGVSQIAALAVFPQFSKRFTRRQLYTASMLMVVIGYIAFFFAPMNIVFIGAAGVVLFAGQAFIQLLMLVFLADTIEYGEWKLGRRNEGVSFAIQPFINKMGGAVANGVLGITLVLSNINSLPDGAEASPESVTMLKSAMMLLPLACIVASYILHSLKYKLDQSTYNQILSDLEERRSQK